MLIWWLIYEAGAFIMSLPWRHLGCAYVRGGGTGSPRGTCNAVKLSQGSHTAGCCYVPGLDLFLHQPALCLPCTVNSSAYPARKHPQKLMAFYGAPPLLSPNKSTGGQPSLQQHWGELIRTVPVPNKSFTIQALPSIFFVATTVHAGRWFFW